MSSWSLKICRIALLLAVLGTPVTPLSAETLNMTEAKALALALDQNLGVKIAESDAAISKTRIMEAKSVFDTVASFEVNHLIDQRDQTSTIFGTDNRTTRWDLGVSKKLPSGTQTSVEWRNERNTTDSPFATFNPNYDSVVALSVQQPLMKNFVGMQDRGQVNLARKNYEAQDANSQRRISEAVFNVLQNYWDWIRNRSNVRVTSQSYSQAKKFEDISKQKEQFGLHESTDVLAAKANSLQILNQLRTAKRGRDDAVGRFRRGLNLKESVRIESSEKMPFSKHLPDLNLALTTALESRPEYFAAKRNLEARKIGLSLAKNAKWPQLDLIASLELNGVNSNYSGSSSEAFSADHPRFFIGGQFRLPLENRAARSGKNRAEVEKVKALYELKDAENKITQDVEEQWRALQTSIKTVRTNRRIQHLQYEKWQEELKKYRTGRSSSDIVIRYQEDYLTAQRVTINSLFNYRMAVLGLRLAQNTLVR